MSGPVHFLAQLLMKNKDMNCQKKYQRNGNAAMQDQDNGELIQNHPKQAGSKRNHDQAKKQPAFCAQFLSVDNGVDNAEQQKQNRCQLMDMYTGQGHHNGNKKANQ